jgi:hypothetical protein
MKDLRYRSISAPTVLRVKVLSYGQGRPQTFTLFGQLVTGPEQLSEHWSPMLLHRSRQLAPAEQSITPLSALSADAVQVELAAQVKWQLLGPEQLRPQVQPDGQDWFESFDPVNESVQQG